MNEDIELDDPISVIFQAIGSASMCWEHVDRAGVFNDYKASEVASRLIDDLKTMGVDFTALKSLTRSRVS